MAKEVLGIDIGGSGIKGAPVRIKQGTLAAERFRIPTPAGGRPKEMLRTITRIVDHFSWRGTIGCGFPAAIRDGVALTAANIDKSWIGIDINSRIRELTGCPCFTLNDADAAATAMVARGDATASTGTVLVVTVGTGLGTALFHNGQLLPNTELGHIRMKGGEAEDYASDRVRKELALSWREWGKRLGAYLRMMEKLFWPELIIIGGGVSKYHEEYAPWLGTETRVIASAMKNEAGIIGAALAAARHFS